jgi:hypothetical protein
LWWLVPTVWAIWSDVVAVAIVVVLLGVVAGGGAASLFFRPGVTIAGDILWER